MELFVNLRTNCTGGTSHSAMHQHCQTDAFRRRRRESPWTAPSVRRPTSLDGLGFVSAKHERARIVGILAAEGGARSGRSSPGSIPICNFYDDVS